MATPEAKVKAAVVKILKKYDVYYFFPATGGYGRSGVPDIICCFQGRFIAIECKANGNVPTELQLRELNKITHAGGIAFVVDELGIEAVEALFAGLGTGQTQHDSIN
jgi:Holliday junction resolvase